MRLAVVQVKVRQAGSVVPSDRRTDQAGRNLRWPGRQAGRQPGGQAGSQEGSQATMQPEKISRKAARQADLRVITYSAQKR